MLISQEGDKERERYSSRDCFGFRKYVSFDLYKYFGLTKLN